MCGRYGRWSRRQRIDELLGIDPSVGPDFPDLYNITPGVETDRSREGSEAGVLLLPTQHTMSWDPRPPDEGGAGGADQE